MRVLVGPDFPGGEECAGEQVLVRFRKDDVGSAVAAPSTGDGKEDVWSFGDELRLNFGREHEVSVSLVLGGERGEDAAANAEIGGAHVRAFFGTFEAQGQPAEVSRSHEDASVADKSTRVLPDGAAN